MLNHTKTEQTEVQLPEGVTTEKNPLKQEFLAKASSKPALFRPSENMPEIVNEDLLRGMSESGKKPGNVSQFIGYMPKLKVLPCAKGCEGSDYERAVKEFIKGYRGDGKYFKERGEMIVQVRWYNTRPFLMRQLPYGADTFGVSFILEGKLVSLGKKSGVGISVSSYELARDIGARMAMELAYTLGMGVKPTYVSTTNNASAGVGGAIMATGAVVDGLLGVEDVRPRIEPATEANSNLLPAIDGIKPGEIEPITEMHYINSLFF
ncbi:hypothetical protein DWG20_00235 [Crenobacter cavernae]|uniref:Uncharacterized protein n=1 Tax=Crenobacter cavernae TaxID=2290923 RepID=A0A345Y230_9NEIS|nr:hypothetical protein DWG20_00235 [Crenobacter cavernae]